ncbi:hypothetical protein SCUP234_06456 [Seiridium cupressi]
MSAPRTPNKQATDQDARFFYTVLKHMKVKPDTDWDAVASELGYNNAGTAQTRFGQIKKKLGLTFDQTPTSQNNRVVKARAPKAPALKAKKAAATKGSAKPLGEDDDHDSDMPVTPTAVKTADFEDEEDVKSEAIDSI